MSDQPNFRSGFVAFLGKPNAGKSTLLNKLVGSRLAAVSHLPQTTRDRFQGILTDDHSQIVFVDLPGMVAANDRLNECLRSNVIGGLEGIDVVLHLIDVNDPEPINGEMQDAMGHVRAPIVLALTKNDGKRSRTDVASWAGENLPADLVARYHSMHAISAFTGHGIDELHSALVGLLPEGEHFYDPEYTTDRDMRYLAQEMIREKVFNHLRDEIPYATAVTVEEFKEREQGKWYIRATIHVERHSQKGIVIGKGGGTLKKISQEARRDIETICDAPVFLDLWVKVSEKWRSKDFALREFGFKPPKKRK